MNSQVITRKSHVVRESPKITSKPNKKQPGCFKKCVDVIKQATGAVCSIAATAFVSAIPTMFVSALQDRSVSKIVGGAGFAIGGGYLICKSSILRIAKSKLFGKRPEEKVPSLTKERAVSAIAGGAMLLYGIHTCLSGIWELVQRKRAQDAELYEQYLQRRAICDETVDFQEMFEFGQKKENLLSQTQEAKDKDSKIIETFVNFTRRCPEADALYKKVETDGAFTVQLFSEDELPNNGGWNGRDRVFYIRRDAHVLEKIRTFIFEKCNAKHSSLHEGVHLQAEAGDLSFYEYFKKTISVEFRSMECHHEVASVCVNKKLFPAPIDTYKEQFDENSPRALNTFERYWAHYISNPTFKRHRDYLKKQFLFFYRDAFCAKNPK